MPICPKEVFLAKLTVTIVYLLYSFMLQYFKKNLQRVNNKTESCIILAQTGCELFPKREFFGKVVQHCFGLAIVSHHAIAYQNTCHRVDHECKVA